MIRKGTSLSAWCTVLLLLLLCTTQDVALAHRSLHSLSSAAAAAANDSQPTRTGVSARFIYGRRLVG
jgi:hypothetical protein